MHKLLVGRKRAGCLACSFSSQRMWLSSRVSDLAYKGFYDLNGHSHQAEDEDDAQAGVHA